MGLSIRAWWRDLSTRFMDAYFKAISRGTIGAPPRVSDRNPVTGEEKEGFRLDVRINPVIYEMYKQLCKKNGETPSQRTRMLIWDWMHAQSASDPWEEFVKKMKSEGFSTPQQWLKTKLGLSDT